MQTTLADSPEASDPGVPLLSFCLFCLSSSFLWAVLKNYWLDYSVLLIHARFLSPVPIVWGQDHVVLLPPSRPGSRPACPVVLWSCLPSGQLPCHLARESLALELELHRASLCRSWNPRTNFEIFTKKNKKPKNTPQGARGVSKFVWGLISPFFW